MTSHEKIVHKNEAFESCSRVRPTQIIHYRNKEALCIFRDSTGTETAEWIDVDDIDDDEIEAESIQLNVVDSDNCDENLDSMPIISNYQQWISSPSVRVEL